MINADGLLYIAKFFRKEALWPEERETTKAQDLISWLTGKGITFNEIEYWLTQNKDLFNSFGISSFKDYQKEHYKHYIVFNDSVNGADLRHTIISLDKSVSDDIFLEINKEGFIKGYKNIPNLYLFIGMILNLKKSLELKKKYNINFLIHFLKKLVILI